MDYYDGSSGVSDVNMAFDGEDADNIEQIQYCYNASNFEGIAPDTQFENQGEILWQKQRAEWLRNTKKNTEVELLDNFHIDVEQVMIYVHQSKTFPEPISLLAMVEILNILWEEDAL